MDSDTRAMAALMKLRRELHDEIRECLKMDGHCKSYEGRFVVFMPGTAVVHARIELHCYVVGPNRHYDWNASTLTKAVKACSRDVRKWIRESRKERRDA